MQTKKDSAPILRALKSLQCTLRHKFLLDKALPLHVVLHNLFPQRLLKGGDESTLVNRLIASGKQSWMAAKDPLMTLVGWTALLGLLVLSGVVGCSSGDSNPSPREESVEQPVPTSKATLATVEPVAGEGYDAQSWHTLIAEDCTVFFDGCNQCRRAPGAKEAACTRKACMAYAEPKCLDSEVGGHSDGKHGEDKVLQYQCSDGESLEVFYGSYPEQDQKVQLEPDQIVVLDAASETAYWVRRVPSGSGEKYESSELMFWVKGNVATVSVHARQNVRECSQLRG